MAAVITALEAVATIIKDSAIRNSVAIYFYVTVLVSIYAMELLFREEYEKGVAVWMGIIAVDIFIALNFGKLTLTFIGLLSLLVLSSALIVLRRRRT